MAVVVLQLLVPLVPLVLLRLLLRLRLRRRLRLLLLLSSVLTRDMFLAAAFISPPPPFFAPLRLTNRPPPCTQPTGGAVEGEGGRRAGLPGARALPRPAG